MRLVRIALLLAAIAGTSPGCGGGAPPMVRPPVAASTEPAPRPAPAVPRTPSPLDALDPHAKWRARVDVARLHGLPFFENLVPLMQMLQGDDHAAADAQCGFRAIDTPREIALSVFDGGGVAAASSLTVPMVEEIACLRGPLHAVDAKLDDGTPVLRLANDLVAVARGEILFAGTPPALQRILKAFATPDAATQARLGLSGDEVAIVDTAVPEIHADRVSAVLHASMEGFAVGVEAEMPSAEEADRQWGVVRRAVIDAEIDPGHLARIGLAAFAPILSVDGRVIRGKLAVAGDKKEQGLAVGSLLGLVTWGTHRYARNTNEREAPRVVQQIANDLVATAAPAAPHGPLRFPPSSSLVPTWVPRGEAFTSTPADWSGSWKEIGFSISDPQYFRYSFVTSRDRRHVVVRAEADLDGNGASTEVYELPLEINGRGDVLRGTMKEPPRLP
jgi:hypothetical protein